jgi:DNA-binding XRE family transcriptional regulator
MTERISPIGTSVTESIEKRKANDPEFARLWEEHRPSREFAWEVIKYRMDHNLTQAEFARLVNTSPASIELIERGQSLSSQFILERVRRVLDGKS